MPVFLETSSNFAAGSFPPSGCLNLPSSTEPLLLPLYLGHDNNELPARASHCAAIDNSYDFIMRYYF